MASRAEATVEVQDSTLAWDVALLLARIIVGGIFLIAGLTKVGDPGGFATSVRAFHLMPEPLVVPFAFIVPWLEILVGLYLLFGFLTRIGAIGSGLLLITFIVALADSLFTGNTAHPCGCFGANPSPIIAILSGGNTVGWWDLIRDVIMLGLAALIVLRGSGTLSVDEILARRRLEDE
jgi:uncharacterized membrane protein YphA (DoxX/SURF4 family)